MDLINLYVQEVGQHLPAATREDIEKEIRTLIDDTLEDQSQVQGRAPDQEMIVDVLKQLGSPHKMAARYLPERYLIGPRLYPQYLTVLKIVLTVAGIVAAIGIGISMGLSADSGRGLPELLGGAISGLIGVLFQAAATVTLIFALIEYFQPDLKLDEAQWDPRQMKPQADSERVSMVGSVLSIFFTVLFLVVINFYPQWLGLSSLVNDQWVHSPVLTPAFFRYLPWINALWIAEIVQQIVLIGAGRWTNATRWMDVAVKLYTLVLAAVMLVGPALISIDVSSFARLGWGSPDAATLRALTDGMLISVRVTLGIIMGVTLLELGKRFYNLVLRDRKLVAA